MRLIPVLQIKGHSFNVRRHFFNACCIPGYVEVDHGVFISGLVLYRFITNSEHKEENHNQALTPWSRVFLEKLTVAQLVKEFPFMKFENLLSCLLEPAIGPYPEQN
jgi:hypothetical protein